jgi:hypothetical protein
VSLSRIVMRWHRRADGRRVYEVWDVTNCRLLHRSRSFLAAAAISNRLQLESGTIAQLRADAARQVPAVGKSGVLVGMCSQGPQSCPHMSFRGFCNARVCPYGALEVQR